MLALSNLSTLLANGSRIDEAFGNLAIAALYAALGVVLFGLFWLIVVKVSPFSIRKEIEDDQNTALGIVLGCGILGIAIIIAAAVSG
jgi:putative membrane protein